MKEVSVQIFQILSPALIAALTWLAAKAAQLIQARVKNEYLRGVLVRLDDAVLSVVREIHQVSVEALKSSAPDGKLTRETKEIVKHAAVTAIKQHLGAKGIGELAKVLGINADGVDKLIGTHVEAAVHDLKAARVLNGVNKGSLDVPFAA